jgi:hypothetical protein
MVNNILNVFHVKARFFNKIARSFIRLGPVPRSQVTPPRPISNLSSSPHSVPFGQKMGVFHVFRIISFPYLSLEPSHLKKSAMVPVKMLLLSSLLVCSLGKFDELKGDVERKRWGLKFHYTSNVIIEEGHYSIVNEIQANTPLQFCLKWPLGGFICDNTRPFTFHDIRKYTAGVPVPWEGATMWLGTNWDDPERTAHCYIDNLRYNILKDKYADDLSYVNERGELVGLTLTASYVPQLHQSTIQIETTGDADVLVEKVGDFAQASPLTDPKSSWDVQLLQSIGNVLPVSKNASEIAAFLNQNSPSAKTFFLCKKSSASNVGPLFLTVPMTDQGGLKDMAVCLVSRSGSHTIGIISKCFSD